MPPDDQHFTYNPLSNEEKELLLANGYRPGELAPEDEQDLLRDLREETSDIDDDSERYITNPDERDGTE